MTQLIRRTLIVLIGFTLIGLYSCNKQFLEISPQGVLDQETVATPEGVNQLLIGAYSSLRQNIIYPAGHTFLGSVDLWNFSALGSDEAHPGLVGDLPYSEQFGFHTVTPVNIILEQKWGNLYTGVQRANDVLRILPKVKGLSSSQSTEIKAEARFLRGLFLFVAAKIWGQNIPYISDSNSYQNNNYIVSNKPSIWPNIEADFQFAADSLPSTQSNVGRPNSWAAKCFLAAAYMFEYKYTQAQSLFNDIIANGVTSSGQKYALGSYPRMFNDPSYDNNPESVFAVQFTIDNSGGANANQGDELNVPAEPGYGGGGNWTQPSFSLVNSFLTDSVTGLPLIYTFNDGNMKNDQGLLPTDPFTPYSGTVDPRLDWTVFRRGIPVLDWGMFTETLVQDQTIGGPYAYRKDFIYKKDATDVTSIGWIYVNDINKIMMRYARVLLLAAEAEVEIGSLDKAEEYVNMVRARAADDSVDWVHTYVDPNDPSQGFTNIPAANYKVGLYPPGYFAMKGKDFARDAVHFEEKIELAMEGFRFFDLRRWDNGTGSMVDAMNAYFNHESQVPNYNFQFGKAGSFTQHMELYPIPQQEIDKSTINGVPQLIQNPGW